MSDTHLHTAGLYGLAGLLLGSAFVSPSLYPAAWCSVAVYAIALARTRSSIVAFLCVVCAHGLTCMVAFPWMWDGNFVMFDYTLREMVALRFGEAMILAVPYGLALGTGHRLLRTRLAPRFWVPLAWVFGEALSFATSNACVDDWLNTQWTVQPVLRALAWVGWWPLVIACLFSAASIGDALALRRWTLALPSVAIALGIAFAPPIADGKASLLEGIGAIHLTPTFSLPRTLPDEVDLLVWPETAIDLTPLLSEGPGNGAKLPPLIPEHPAQHLIGLRTKLPGGVRHNQAVAMDASGRVMASRAKQLFLPVAERRFLGVGRTPYASGTRPPLLKIAGRAVVPLICGEGLSRGLLAQGVAGGGRLWTVLAGDQWLASERALRQFLAIQVLRSVEFGVPSIRASYAGRSTFVAADGRVLAVSSSDRNGVLVWSQKRGARDYDFRGRLVDGGRRQIDPPPDIAVLYSQRAPELRARCPEGACRTFALETFQCPSDASAKVVIVSGHGRPPDYLGQPAHEVAAAARCFKPELVVIDTCLGASSELLSAFGGLDAIIVAAPALLSTSGFRYDRAFFEARDPWRRAAAVRTVPEIALLRWRNDPDALSRLLARVATMDAHELSTRLVRRVPATVKVDLEPGGPVLVPIDWKRLGAQGLPMTLRRPVPRKGTYGGPADLSLTFSEAERIP